MKKTIYTLEELKKKKLEFVENYSFKEEDDKSWSFIYRRKKAFILNLADPINVNVITPFFMRRNQLGIICERLFYEIEKESDALDTQTFFSYSIEVIGNMLDNKKMGSTENFINYVWDNIKETNDISKIVSTFGDLVTMIDLSVEKQITKYSQDEMKDIHNNFFAMINEPKVFKVHSNGTIEQVFRNEKKDNPEPENEYDLANMTPINREEI